MSEQHCACVDVEMGSYDNQVLLPLPPHMEQYRQNRMAAGLSGDGIPIDRCCVPEIKFLWSRGIHTRGCCCGHNKVPPMVNVAEESILGMIELGYETCHTDSSRMDTFRLKLIGFEPEGL